MLTAAALGLAVGLRHAFDPDHLIAVSTLVSRTRRPAASVALGVAWGLGHSLTILSLGGVLVLLGVAVPMPLARAAEAGVGLLLVGLGASNLRSLHGGPPSHGHPRVDAGLGSRELPLHRALTRCALVGLAHGLAGTGPVAVAALVALPTPASALVYLGVFALATLVGMALASLGLGLPLAAAGSGPRLQRWACACSGAVAVGFGAYLVVSIGLSRGAL